MSWNILNVHDGDGNDTLVTTKTAKMIQIHNPYKTIMHEQCWFDLFYRPALGCRKTVDDVPLTSLHAITHAHAQPLKACNFFVECKYFYRLSG